MGITSALQSSAIKRLHKTWAEVSEEDNKFIEESLNLMSYVGSYKNYREVLSSIPSGVPFIPFIGICLSDLIFTEEGNTTFISTEKINCNKIRLIGKSISQTFKLRMAYNFDVYHEIENWYNNVDVFDEEEAYSLSTKLEPRDKSEALEKLLITEAKLQKDLEQISVRQEAYAVSIIKLNSLFIN